MERTFSTADVHDSVGRLLDLFINGSDVDFMEYYQGNAYPHADVILINIFECHNKG